MATVTMRFAVCLMIGLLSGGVALVETSDFDGTDSRTEVLMRHALQSIDEIRKGQLSVNLEDASGRPLDGSVQIELAAHDFDFGANLLGAYDLREGDSARAAAMDAIDSVFNTVIVCDYWRSNQM